MPEYFDAFPGVPGKIYNKEQLLRGEQMVSLAYKELDRPVLEIPLGSNTSPRIVLYQQTTWLGGTNWEWCVAFWMWLYKQVFGEKYWWPTAGAYDLLKNSKAYRVARPYPGCAVVFNVGSGHVATFVRFEDDGQTIVTVDGNSQDRVREARRPVSTVAGYVAPELPLGVTKEPKPPKRPPIVQVVTSESGSVQILATGDRFKASKVAAGKIAYLLTRGNVTITGADGKKIVLRRKKG